MIGSRGRGVPISLEDFESALAAMAGETQTQAECAAIARDSAVTDGNTWTTNIVSGTNVVVVHSLDNAQASAPVMVSVQRASN